VACVTSIDVFLVFFAGFAAVFRGYQFLDPAVISARFPHMFTTIIRDIFTSITSDYPTLRRCVKQ